MKAQVFFLIPFDMGLELDFREPVTKGLMKQFARPRTEPISFRGTPLAEGDAVARIYNFGVGLLQVSFFVQVDLDFYANLASRIDLLRVGSAPIAEWARATVGEVLGEAKQFATYQYEVRLEEIQVFPILSLEPGVIGDAEVFLRENRKTLYGMVSGEPSYDMLSSFVLEQEKLVNFGYYENELILIKRFGAVISSFEAETILDMIRLAYAVYWNLRSYNSLLDREIGRARTLVAHLPPWHKFWVMPRWYERFSSEAMDFVRDKLAIVESIYQVFGNVLRIDSDWHLRTIYRYVEQVFDIGDLSKAVNAKLDRIEQCYSSAQNFISTNFFIAVEILLMLSFAWMVLDTALLFVIAHK
ncbi:conserved protein of unknown function [Methylacidimicrobium sp. AP8]|uniref:hypothetical protein n=1 Tax=Methylacidimicrobium sp. AP8 TaxID=2730359 RepID=UPI0018BFF4E6|nr:hypothetical protein [Methylacidimicrobium sp. AP8]CAB4243976.1 conserved protein of unknown function [Methylacidimicrobium sp. AP8]